jgi:hypothetical protein
MDFHVTMLRSVDFSFSEFSNFLDFLLKPETYHLCKLLYIINPPSTLRVSHISTLAIPIEGTFPSKITLFDLFIYFLYYHCYVKDFTLSRMSGKNIIELANFIADHRHTLFAIINAI